MAHVLPKYLTKWTTEKLKKEGVNVINNAEVTQVEMKNNKVLLHVNNGQQQVKKLFYYYQIKPFKCIDHSYYYFSLGKVL